MRKGIPSIFNIQVKIESLSSFFLNGFLLYRIAKNPKIQTILKP